MKECKWDKVRNKPGEELRGEEMGAESTLSEKAQKESQ